MHEEMGVPKIRTEIKMPENNIQPLKKPIKGKKKKKAKKAKNSDQEATTSEKIIEAASIVDVSLADPKVADSQLYFKFI